MIAAQASSDNGTPFRRAFLAGALLGLTGDQHLLAVDDGLRALHEGEIARDLHGKEFRGVDALRDR